MASLSHERNEIYRIHWKFKVRLGPLLGQTFRGSLQLGRCTKSAAKKQLRKIEDWEQSVKTGRHVPNQNLTTIVEAWMHERGMDCRPQSVTRMRQTMRLYLRWRSAMKLPSDEVEEVAHREEIAAWRDHRLDHEAGRKTVANDLSTLSSFFTWCVREHYLSENPVDRVTRPRFVAHKEGTPLSRQQAGRWLKDIRLRRSRSDKGPRTWREVQRKRQIAVFLLNTGVRNGEFCSANIEDLRLDDQEQLLFVTGKGLKQRWVPLNIAALAAIRCHLRSRANPTKGPLWVTQCGDRYNVRQLSSELIQTAYATTEPIKVNPHNLRHTFATWLTKSGADPALTQKILGHENINTTFRYYVHTSDNELASATARLRPNHLQTSPPEQRQPFRVIPFPLTDAV